MKEKTVEKVWEVTKKVTSYIAEDGTECRVIIMEYVVDRPCIKPYQIKNCKRFDVCESSRLGGCVGCNVWNYLYDIDALKEWCEKQNVDFMSMSKYMRETLKEE